MFRKQNRLFKQYLSYQANAQFSVSVKELVGFNPVRGFSLRFMEMEKKNPNCINLALGVPMDPTFPSIVEAKHNFVDFSAQVGNNGYGDPRGIEPLRKNLTASFRKNYNQPESVLNENNIVIVPGGTSNALCLTVEKLVRGTNGEGEIIVLAPYFGPYVGMIKLAGGKPVILDTVEDFQPDLEAIEKAITPNTKAIIVNSPNNPTGKVYPRETLEKIIDITKKHNVAIISDEIYKKFVYNEQKPFISYKEYFADHMDQNLIVINAPSKTYGMIGDRLGYVVSNQPEFIEDIVITLGYRFATTPYFPQHAYNSIFDNMEEIQQGIKNNRDQYKKKADFLVAGLQDLGLNAGELEGGMFAMTEVKSGTGMDGNELSNFFLEQEEAPIAVYPGSFFGSSYKDYLRFTICPTQETLEKGLKQIEVYLKKIRG